MDAGDVYRQLSPAVLGYLRGQRVADAEDLLGDIFFQVARSIPRFRGDDAEDLRRWVFTIARNRVIDDARRRARRPQVSTDVVVEQVATDEPDALDPDLLRALAQLTPDQREVVALRFIADLSLDDVAKITRRKAGAVKSMQARALAQLARVLEQPPDVV